MNKYAKASEAHFRAMKLEAEAVLDTYFNSTVGIDEHLKPYMTKFVVSDIPEEINKWVERMSTAEDALETLARYTVLDSTKTKTKIV